MAGAKARRAGLPSTILIVEEDDMLQDLACEILGAAKPHRGP